MILLSKTSRPWIAHLRHFDTIILPIITILAIMAESPDNYFSEFSSNVVTMTFCSVIWTLCIYVNVKVAPE